MLLSLQTSTKLKLPKLTHNHTVNATKGEKHLKATTERWEPDFQLPAQPPLGKPFFESSLKDDGTIEYATESDVQGFIKIYLESARRAAGLSECLSIFREYFFKSYRPDILVLVLYSSDGTPRGVVEVKKPLWG